MIPGPVAQGAGKAAAPAGVFAVLSEMQIGGINMELVGAIVIGLIGGAVMRSSVFFSQEATGLRIRRDLAVSALAGLGNFIISAILVAIGSLAVPGFPSLAAAGVAMVIGFRGNDNVAWFARKYMELDIGSIGEGLYRASPPDRNTPEELDQLAHKLDEPAGPPGRK